MIDIFRKMLGDSPPGTPPDNPPLDPDGDKPPIPAAELAAFKAWFLHQARPAVALVPDASGAIGKTGSRLGGPAWLADGEAWPLDAHGVPLEFLAQLDCADCRSLGGYPADGIIQFFIGRSDVFGCDFLNPAGSTMLVRRCDVTRPGTLSAPPPLSVDGAKSDAYNSPFENDRARSRGIALRAKPITDRIDQSVKAAEERVTAPYERYDISALDAFLKSEEAERPQRHHTGGFPAYTQTDLHFYDAFADYDHVLLRLTSDETLMWGDVGECVFLIRSDDLARGDFSDVAYSWDCS